MHLEKRSKKLPEKTGQDNESDSSTNNELRSKDAGRDKINGTQVERKGRHEPNGEEKKNEPQKKRKGKEGQVMNSHDGIQTDEQVLTKEIQNELLNVECFGTLKIISQTSQSSSNSNEAPKIGYSKV